MDIQTERERNPTVRNIERDAPETQVDTETFENQAGLKTAKQSGIQTVYEDEAYERESLQKFPMTIQRKPMILKRIPA